MSFITNFHPEIHKHTRIPTQEPPSTMSYNRLKFKNWLRVKIGSLWLSWKVFTGIKKKIKKIKKILAWRKFFFYLWNFLDKSKFFGNPLINAFFPVPDGSWTCNTWPHIAWTTTSQKFASKSLCALVPEVWNLTKKLL